MARAILRTSGLVLAVFAIQGQSGAQAAAAEPPMVTVQMAEQPKPAPVTLDPKTTALLVFDYVDPTCTRQAKCTAMVPKLAALMARARKAGVVVGYGTKVHNKGHWIPEVAPAPGDVVVENVAQDRFYSTDLDKQLKAKGITTLILAGWSVNGGVTYTSVGATARGYTVVVPVDTTSGGTDFSTAAGFFQILNQDDRNTTNEPLKTKTSTLSRTDLITFK